MLHRFLDTQSMDEENKSIDVDSSDCSNSNTRASMEKPLVATPVDGGSSGRGLPYAPEGWPRPGDVWIWKVGRRATVSGYWHDKSLYPPRHLKNLPAPVFHSRLSLEQYIRKEYPEANVDAFFASFIWKVPAAGHKPKEGLLCLISFPLNNLGYKISSSFFLAFSSS